MMNNTKALAESFGDDDQHLDSNDEVDLTVTNKSIGVIQ
jgi:hypothetical protein